MISYVISSRAQTQAQDGAAFVLEGVVIDELSGAPIPGARVFVATGAQALFSQYTRSAEAALPSPLPAAITDSRGRFRLNRRPSSIGEQSAAYRIGATADGYAEVAYGATTTNGFGAYVNELGPIEFPLVISLPRTARIEGTVTDRAELPAAHIPVYLLERVLGLDGVLLIAVAETTTNDSGAFAFSDVQPRRAYYVAAGNPYGSPSTGQAGTAVAPYAIGFYPGVSDASAATPVFLQPGMHLTTVDLTLDRAQPHRVRGRLLDPLTGRPPQRAELALHFAMPFRTVPASPTRPVAYSENDGSFQVDFLVDGQYALAVTPDEGQREPVRSPLGSIYRPRLAPTAWAPFDILGADIDALEIASTGQSRLRGRITLGDSSPSRSGRISISFRPTNALQPDPGVVVVTLADAVFDLPSAFAGVYRFGITGLDPDHYVSEIRLNGTRLADWILEIPNGTSEMEIALDSPSARIDGRVLDADDSPAPGATGIILPDPLPNIVGYFQLFFSDSRGTFSLLGLPPGRFSIFAFAAAGRMDLPGPTEIRRWRLRGTSIRLDRGTRATAVVYVSRVDQLR